MNNNSTTKHLDSYFNKYNNICNKILFQKIKVENLKEKLISISSIKYKHQIIKNNSQNGIDDKLIEIEKAEQYLKKLYKTKENQKKKYITTLKKLSNTTHQIILISFYLDHINLKSIAVNLNLSLSHVKKLKRDAIKELILFLEKNKT